MLLHTFGRNGRVVSFKREDRETTWVLCVDKCNALLHMLINFFYISVSFQLPSSVTMGSSLRGHGGIFTSTNAEVTRIRLLIV